MLKIAITGAQGVGKTTLAKQIAEAFPNIKILPEAARLALEAGFKLDDEADIETELWLLAKQIEMEKLAGSWVADRCFVDFFIYNYHFFRERKEWISLLRKIALRKAIQYDLIFYLPAGEFPLDDDGVRKMDGEFQKKIDEMIKHWLYKYDIKFYYIEGPMEQRLRTVKRIIENKKALYG